MFDDESTKTLGSRETSLALTAPTNSQPTPLLCICNRSNNASSGLETLQTKYFQPLLRLSEDLDNKALGRELVVNHLKLDLVVLLNHNLHVVVAVGDLLLHRRDTRNEVLKVDPVLAAFLRLIKLDAALVVVLLGENFEVLAAEEPGNAGPVTMIATIGKTWAVPLLPVKGVGLSTLLAIAVVCLSSTDLNVPSFSRAVVDVINPSNSSMDGYDCKS